LSIGEVLGLLLEEFPDITISKIRFLESQGLIEPERTASGYRKFYDADVDRLRFILREQKEHYLPLKVIKDRLDGEGTPETGMPRGIRNVTVPASEPPAAAPAAPEPGSSNGAPTGSRGRSTHPSAARSAPPATEASRAEAATMPDKLPIAPATTTTSASPPDVAPEATTEAAPETTGPASQLSRAELLAACGVEGGLLDELESYGLVTPRRLGQQPVYDQHAVTVVELAKGFSEAGIEVRHLRAYKTAAEREAGLYEQRILPMLRQRNPRARDQSMELLDQLVSLGARLHAALVEQALRPHREHR
jgi:DNA-binding transcriptional MerR regulator